MLASVDNQVAEPTARTDRRFGELLRFWRKAFGMSQEDLADRAGISVRHLSFLENGRTRPSADAVEKIGESLGVGVREQTILALAARCAPGPGNRCRPLVEPSRADWRLILRSADPTPTSIMDRFGRILAVNRGWSALHREYLGDLVDADNLNALDLFLHPLGWRRFVKNWTLIASVMLVIIVQEAMLYDDERALRDVRRWTETPGLPGGWPVIGARLSGEASGYSYSVATNGDGGPHYRIVHSTLGYFAADQGCSLILQSAYPQGAALWPLARFENYPRHPLCLV